MHKKHLHIVIEGTDGSGKATQAKLLKERFLKEGVPAELIDFPRYGTPSCYFVEKYLHGGFGTAEEVGPFAGSLFFALDRYDFAPVIRKHLAEGTRVVCDRYTAANMGHQAGKIPVDEEGTSKRDAYLDWLVYTEYTLLQIPKPDITIFLYVDPVINQRLMSQRPEKEYLKGKKQDIHEEDIEHMRSASDAFLYVARKFGWVIIDCAPKTTEYPEGNMLSREEIHEEVWKCAL
jgi:thymidylate kinase